MHCAIDFLRQSVCQAQATAFFCFARASATKKQHTTSEHSTHSGKLAGDVVDCIGSWSIWGKCNGCGSNAQKQRRFLISQHAQNNGAACPFDEHDVQDRACARACFSSSPTSMPSATSVPTTISSARSASPTTPTWLQHYQKWLTKSTFHENKFPSLFAPDKRITSIHAMSEHFPTEEHQDDDDFTKMVAPRHERALPSYLLATCDCFEAGGPLTILFDLTHS